MQCYKCLHLFTQTNISLYPVSSSYFVEYHFPLPSAINAAGKSVPEEVTRVVSSKVVGGGEWVFFQEFLPELSKSNKMV